MSGNDPTRLRRDAGGGDLGRQPARRKAAPARAEQPHQPLVVSLSWAGSRGSSNQASRFELLCGIIACKLSQWLAHGGSRGRRQASPARHRVGRSLIHLQNRMEIRQWRESSSRSISRAASPGSTRPLNWARSPLAWGCPPGSTARKCS